MALFNDLPHDIRLVAAISRLIDFHQSRRDSKGTYVPDVPDKAGFNLHLALTIINVLHEIEMDRGNGYCPVDEVARLVRNRLPNASHQDVETAIINLSHGREIHYGFTDEHGVIGYARTWDTTPLMDVQGSMSQVRLSENARLFLRVSSLKESWLYSDLDADRLNKAFERRQFQDVPGFCRSMTLDLAAKGKQLTGVLERPSLAELRLMLASEGVRIQEALSSAASIIRKAIEWAYSDVIRNAFEEWAERYKPGYYLENLQAEMDLVLQSVEVLSRQFLRFLELAQQVRHEGGQPINFLSIADWFVQEGSGAGILRAQTLMAGILPVGINSHLFLPDFLTGEANLCPPETRGPSLAQTFEIDPSLSTKKTRLIEAIIRNRDLILDHTRQSPLSFSQMIEITDFKLEPNESVLDFFGIYTTPRLLSSGVESVYIGFTGEFASFCHDGWDISSSDPVIFLGVNDVTR